MKSKSDPSSSFDINTLPWLWSGAFVGKRGAYVYLCHVSETDNQQRVYKWLFWVSNNPLNMADICWSNPWTFDLRWQRWLGRTEGVFDLRISSRLRLKLPFQKTVTSRRLAPRRSETAQTRKSIHQLTKGILASQHVCAKPKGQKRHACSSTCKLLRRTKQSLWAQEEKITQTLYWGGCECQLVNSPFIICLILHFAWTGSGRRITDHFTLKSAGQQWSCTSHKLAVRMSSSSLTADSMSMLKSCKLARLKNKTKNHDVPDVWLWVTLRFSWVSRVLQQELQGRLLTDAGTHTSVMKKKHSRLLPTFVAMATVRAQGQWNCSRIYRLKQPKRHESPACYDEEYAVDETSELWGSDTSTMRTSVREQPYVLGVFIGKSLAIWYVSRYASHNMYHDTS